MGAAYLKVQLIIESWCQEVSIEGHKLIKGCVKRGNLVFVAEGDIRET